MRGIIKRCVTIGLLICSFAACAEESFDVVVYGGTSGGVIAAVQAGRMGKSVVLIEPGQHLGGMTTGGLGATDMGNQAAIGGVSREFYGRILKYYEDKSVWKQETPEAYAKREHYIFKDAMFGFEPHVAEKILNDMAAEAKVKVVKGQRLDLKQGGKKERTRIISIKMESGDVYAGKAFIDGTYEGDLLAKVGVSYMLGREANSQFGETLNGVQVAHAKAHQFGPNIDPYVKPGDQSSGLVPNIHAGDPGKDGEADKRMQAYNYRICMTDAPDNRVPFPKPAGYDERDYELLLRAFEAGLGGAPWGPRGMPNRKTDTNNNGAFSTDFIGMNDDYPEADYATRERIIADHIKYTQGFLWTLANHPRVPEKVRASASKCPALRARSAADDRPVRHDRGRLRVEAQGGGSDRPGFIHDGLAQHAALRRRHRTRAQRGRRAGARRRAVRDQLSLAGAQGQRVHQPAGAGLHVGDAHRVWLNPHGAGLHDHGSGVRHRGVHGARRRRGRAAGRISEAARAAAGG